MENEPGRVARPLRDPRHAVTHGPAKIPAAAGDGALRGWEDHARPARGEEGLADRLLPRPLLETLALQMMQPLVPGLTAVSIDDPRDVG